MSHNKQSFVQGHLTIHISQTPSRITLIWQGISDEKVPTTFFRNVQTTVESDLKGKSLVVDLRLLEFMNSSTLGMIMGFIKELDAKGIHILIRFDEQVDWQRINGHCMKTISRTLKNLTVESN